MIDVVSNAVDYVGTIFRQASEIASKCEMCHSRLLRVNTYTQQQGSSNPLILCVYLETSMTACVSICNNCIAHRLD